jgi:hypothetical protein
MTALNDRFWAKVLFSQFIKHYRKMTPEQKVADIDASMDALEDLDDTGDSFGAKMVRWSMERVNQYPQASENGKKGGRPRKNPEETQVAEATAPSAGGSCATNEARESQRRTGADSLRSDCHSAPVRLPSFDEFTQFVDQQGLDYTDAREWWEMTMVDRDGHDRDGNPIGNWKGAIKRFCKNRAAKRSKGEVK